jgi:hypothetical protein
MELFKNSRWQHPAKILFSGKAIKKNTKTAPCSFSKDFRPNQGNLPTNKKKEIKIQKSILLAYISCWLCSKEAIYHVTNSTQ